MVTANYQLCPQTSPIIPKHKEVSLPGCKSRTFNQFEDIKGKAVP